MRRLLIILLLIVASICVLSGSIADREVIYDDSLDFVFTSLISYNIGFTREPVSGAAKPTDDGFAAEDHNGDELQIRFLPDASTGGYTTGAFNFYAQVFTQNHVKFTIEATPLSDGKGVTVHYVNTASETSSVFGGSNASGTLLDENQLSADRNKPRTYNREICLEVTGDDNISKIINATDDLTGYIKVTAVTV